MFHNFEVKKVEAITDEPKDTASPSPAVIARHYNSSDPTSNLTRGVPPISCFIPQLSLGGYSQYDALMQQAYLNSMMGVMSPGIPFFNGLTATAGSSQIGSYPNVWHPSQTPIPFSPAVPYSLNRTLQTPSPMPKDVKLKSPPPSDHPKKESEKHDSSRESSRTRDRSRERYRSRDSNRSRRNESRRSESSSNRRRRSPTPNRRVAERSSYRDRSSRHRGKSPIRRKRSRSRSRDSRPGSYNRYQQSSRNSKGRNFKRSKSRSPSRKDPKSAVRLDNFIKKEIKEEPLDKRSDKDRDDELRFSSDNYSSSDENEKIPELTEEDYRMEIASYTRCVAAELYFDREGNNCYGTERFKAMLNDFQEQLLTRNERARATQKPFEKPKRKPHICMHFKKKPKVIRNRRDPKRKPTLVLASSDSSDTSDSDWCSSEDEENLTELEMKRMHPYRLHDELWFNETGEMNDGPLCRCSIKSRRSGIRHNCFPGEQPPDPPCDPNSNNADRLYHYRIAISPKTNFVLRKFPTIIKEDKHEYIFEGFSMFSHYKLPENLPSCRVIRYNIEYVIAYIEEECPTDFTVGGLDMLTDFLFKEVLELIDINWKLNDQVGGCPQFHLMPRFVRPLAEKGKELLSLNYVIRHLLRNSKSLVSPENLPRLANLSNSEYIDLVESNVKAQIIVKPGMRPCALRIDQMDRELTVSDETKYPEVIHFGMRPAQLSYAGNPKYQKALKDLTKFRKYLATKPRVDYKDKAKLAKKERQVMDLKLAKDLKRDVTIVMSAEGFIRTGIRSDVVQHALIIPVLIGHLRFQKSLHKLEENISLKFNDRLLLQLALTHPSYRENFGTNPDHARNSMINCGMRQPEYGDRGVLYLYSRKRGIKMLLSIMSRLAKDIETASTVHHYERLEFLGDAVIEFLSSIHLFHMFPDVEEGGLATYRAAIVQNQHLAVLAKKLQLDDFMLYAHGSDLCHDLELKHAMANSFEALMGAIFLDQGLDAVDRVFGETLFGDDPELMARWKNYTKHPLQLEEPDGDRHWIEHYPVLRKLTEFEERIGIQFTHIRLLARAFTHRSVGFNNLTLGSNQRLEFLGDTVLQLVSSEYLYKYFPEHHEGHLSLLRSSIVNNRTQSVVHDDLGMLDFSLYPASSSGLKIKDRADILEAFLGSLYVDKGMEYCRRFCQVVFFPRLEQFIRNQDWNDPKSKLQQCCLTLRHMNNGQPEIPLYKVIDSSGPTNTRSYVVAVYFRGKRMATASGPSIKDAQYHAASEALAGYKNFFNHKVVEDIIKGKPSHERRSNRREHH